MCFSKGRTLLKYATVGRAHPHARTHSTGAYRPTNDQAACFTTMDIMQRSGSVLHSHGYHATIRQRASQSWMSCNDQTACFTVVDVMQRLGRVLRSYGYHATIRQSASQPWISCNNQAACFTDVNTSSYTMPSNSCSICADASVRSASGTHLLAREATCRLFAIRCCPKDYSKSAQMGAMVINLGRQQWRAGT